MENVIKDIIHRDISKDKKLKALTKLEEDIVKARRILSDEFTYCEECDDYYLTDTFKEIFELEEENILTYFDPINSGGNEYRKATFEKTYLRCPKGHKKLIFSQELKR